MMHRLSITAFAPILSAAAVLSPALSRALPTDDVRTGTAVFLSWGEAHLNGDVYVAQDRHISKTHGTLDLYLSAAALGLDSTLVVHLRGVAGADRIVWDFSEALPEPLSVAEQTSVRHIDGVLVTRVEHVRALADPLCAGTTCPFSVRLRSLPGSYGRVSGTTWFGAHWERSIDLDLDIYAGFPRPRVTSLSLSAPARVTCRADGARVYGGRVHLDSAAPSGGAWVEIGSTDPSLLTAHRLHVPAGARDASFRVTFPAAYEGAAAFHAASGGTIARRLVEVGRGPYCFLGELPYGLSSIMQETFDCAACAESWDFGSPGAALATVDGVAYFVGEAGATPVEDLVGEPTTSARIGGRDLVAMLEGGAERAAIIRDAGETQAPPVMYDGFSPVSINPNGVVFGFSGVPGNGEVKSLHFDGRQLRLTELDVPAPEFLLSNSADTLAGTYRWDDVLRVFVRRHGQSYDVGDLGSHTIVEAINAVGDVVGTAEDDQGLRRAFVVPYDDSQLWPIEPPPGYVNTRATAIADPGWVFFTADRGEPKDPGDAFVASRDAGPFSVAELAAGAAQSLRIYEVLDVSADLELAVAGVLDGTRGVFLLTPEL